MKEKVAGGAPVKGIENGVARFLPTTMTVDKTVIAGELRVEKR